MEQRVSMIALGVADLARAKAFYEGVVGWRAAEGPPEIVFFDLGGVIISLYPHGAFAKEMTTDPAAVDTANAAPVRDGAYEGFALAHNARSEAEVDAIFARLQERGATILKPPERVFWGGYSGYFADLDGHNWEVAYNPFWTIGDDGRIAMTPP